MYDCPKDHSNYQYLNYDGSQKTIKGISLFSTLADIIKIPPIKVYKNYTDFTRTKEDEEKIAEIVTALGTRSYNDLMFGKDEKGRKIKPYIEKIGEEVRPVNPMRFLGYIFSNSQTKECMKKLFNDFFIRWQFMEGLSPRLDLEVQKGTFQKFYRDFASEAHVSAEGIKPFIDKKDWKGMISYMLENSSAL